MASKVTRREFIRDGVAAFTLSFAAPAFLVDIARAQGAVSRYLDTMPSPIDPLSGWNTSGATYRALTGTNIAVPSITNPAGYSFASPNSGAEAINERNSAIRLASTDRPDRPSLAFVNTSAMEAFATLDRVASVVSYQSTLTYPNNGFAQALKTVAGSIAKGIGTRVYWVQTGGFDT